MIRKRPRILRQQVSLRHLAQENWLRAEDLIAPLFIEEGEGKEQAIPSLPGYSRRSLDKTIESIEPLIEAGIQAVLLFCKCPEPLKDNSGHEALNPEGLMQRSIRAIKAHFPSLCVMTDVALDPYSKYGHDGIVQDRQILNDASVAVLAEMAVSHAEAGADVVAPSDMMDGRIGAMRAALEAKGYPRTAIMSYAVKYASCFYGPFRSALDSAPGFGDKKSYQMNPANARAALREAELDVSEGADILMVKPAISYLDIIHRVRQHTHLPIAAYQVSGEYAMIKAAAAKGWVDPEAAMLETLLSIKRAGADMIATYFVNDLIPFLR